MGLILPEMIIPIRPIRFGAAWVKNWAAMVLRRAAVRAYVYKLIISLETSVERVFALDMHGMSDDGPFPRRLL